MIRIILCFVMSVILFAMPISADETERLQAQRRFLLTGMRAEREKLRSGQVVITGEHWNTTPALGKQRLAVRFEVYFDLDSRRYRYTQRDYVQYQTAGMEPQTKASLWGNPDLPKGTTADGIEWVAALVGGTIVHTPEYDLHNPGGHPHVTRLASGAATGTAVREWDFSTFGLVDWLVFESRQGFEQILDAFETRLRCHSVETNSSGLTCLTLQSDWTQSEIWIDEKQGMTPIRLSRRDRKDSLKETSHSEIGWEAMHGAMVPVTFRISTVHREEYTEGYDLTLEWSHVNEPLDPKVFTPAGITESAGAMIADMRLGQVVVERVHPLPVSPATPKPVAANARSQWGWIILVNLVIVGGGFAWWYSRRRSQST